MSLGLSFLKGGKGLSVNPLAKSIVCLCQFCFLFEKEKSLLLLPRLLSSYSYTHAVIHTNIHIGTIVKNNWSLKLQFKPLINQILPWPDHCSCFSIFLLYCLIMFWLFISYVIWLATYHCIYFLSFLFFFFFKLAAFSFWTGSMTHLLLYFHCRTHIWKIAKEQ